MKCLIVEDELVLAQSIQDYLKQHDFVCELVSTTQTAIEKIELHQYDCVLLDLALPDGHGFDVIRHSKQQRMDHGIIIISAKENLDSRIEGLQLGADDYLTKPFHLSELLVRIQALVRRKQFQGQNDSVFNEIVFNLLTKRVTVNDTVIDLTKKEFELLTFLIGNNGKVISKSAIAEHLSGDMADLFDNYDFVYAHMKNLKKKLVAAGANDYIKTVYGLGYKWQDA